jgi:hypothetical protein
MVDLLLNRAAPVLAGLLLLSCSATAQAEITQFTGLVCHSPSAVESVIVLHENNPENSIDENIGIINRKSGADVCAIRSIMAENGDIVSRFSSNNVRSAVVRVKIYMECKGLLCVSVLENSEDAFVATPDSTAPVVPRRETAL